MKKAEERCPECGDELEVEYDETSCCWCCPACSYERIERE